MVWRGQFHFQEKEQQQMQVIALQSFKYINADGEKVMAKPMDIVNEALDWPTFSDDLGAGRIAIVGESAVIPSTWNNAQAFMLGARAAAEEEGRAHAAGKSAAPSSEGVDLDIVGLIYEFLTAEEAIELLEIGVDPEIVNSLENNKSKPRKSVQASIDSVREELAQQNAPESDEDDEEGDADESTDAEENGAGEAE